MRLVAVLVNGQQFLGRRVTVVGVLSVEFEDVNLYLSEDAYRYSDTSNSIGLTLTPAQLSALKSVQGRYIAISGAITSDSASKVSGSVRVGDIARVAMGGPSLPRE